MRIVCWNVRGTGPTQENTAGRSSRRKSGLLDYLERWNVDVAIFLEPPKWMRDKVDVESTLTERKDGVQGPAVSQWKLRGYKQGHPQGHVFVVYKGENIKVTIPGGVSVPGSAQDNHLVFIKTEKDDETRVIATCHTPFANNSGEASQYNIYAMKQVLLKDQPKIGVLAGSTDIWMVDLNTYGSAVPAGSSAAYSIALAEPTSGFGPAGGKTHYPLDKIIVRAGLNPSAGGRVAPSQLAGPSKAEATDITESDWKSGSEVSSDHLPIYIDTSPVADATDTSPVAEDPEPLRKRRRLK